jgi:mRNA degradation ribonuclease J1/J2
MWSGYLNSQEELYAFSDKYNLNMQEIHSSGHAYKKDLLKFINTLKPKTVIPVHTLSPEIFRKEVRNIKVTTTKQISL